MSNRHNSLNFKSGSNRQAILFPPHLSEMVPEFHPVRVVDNVIDQLNLSTLLDTYSTMGASSYNPRMMLKVLIFSYLNNIYSSRKIEACLKENIYMMWLSCMQYPDHNTIARFRSATLKPFIKEIFFDVVKLLIQSDHISMQAIYTDGTKIESKANKYTFVWGKSIDKSLGRIEANLEELWDYAESVQKEETENTRPESFKPVSTKEVLKTIQSIENKLKDVEVSKKIKDKLKYVKKNSSTKGRWISTKESRNG